MSYPEREQSRPKVKSDRAADATVAIVETFDKVQTLKQELLELHNETDKEVRLPLCGTDSCFCRFYHG